MKRWRRIPFRNFWLISVMGGILAGTIGANLLSGELLKQIGYFDGIFYAGREMNGEEQKQLWLYVLRQRAWEAGFGGLLAMTPAAAAAYLVLAFAAGAAAAMVITVFTLEKGWMGLGYWLASVLPHGLCYGAVWVIWAAAVMERQDIRKFKIWILAGLLVTGGSLLEVWVNPWLLKFM
ncbi:MAG: hypothetical protein HFG74_11420 [Hungatella sp.]|nr:hypothetical protein [Hungatella sp.]